MVSGKPQSQTCGPNRCSSNPVRSYSHHHYHHHHYLQHHVQPFISSIFCMGLENRRSLSPVIPSYDMLCDDGENEALVAVLPRLGHGRRCCFCLEAIYGVLVHMEDGSAVHWGCSLIHAIWREIRAERRHQRRLATWSHRERFNAVRARRRRPLGPRPPPRLRSGVADSLSPQTRCDESVAGRAHGWVIATRGARSSTALSVHQAARWVLRELLDSSGNHRSQQTYEITEAVEEGKLRSSRFTSGRESLGSRRKPLRSRPPPGCVGRCRPLPVGLLVRALVLRRVHRYVFRSGLLCSTTTPSGYARVFDLGRIPE
jgi:hypothetical protein